jgi:hypothetical protein
MNTEQEPQDYDVPKRKKKSPLSKSFFPLFVVLILILAFLTYQHNRAPSPEKQRQIQEKQNTQTIEAVKKIMLVPSEQPIIATIEQAETLVKEQPFYGGAQNGDKLLIFPNAKKAVIYNPTGNKIINAGPFVLSGESTLGAQAKPSVQNR